MAFLLFKAFCWYWSCRVRLILLFLVIIIFLTFFLILSIIFNIIQSTYWQRKIKKISNNQEKILKQMLPLIDLGKIYSFSISGLKNSLTILRLILDEFRDPDFVQDDKKVKEYLTKANSTLLRIIKNSNLLRWQFCQEEDKRLFDLKDEIKSLLAFYQEVALKYKIKIKLTVDREYRVYADCYRLVRVINILLLNATEALIVTNSKSKSIAISLEKNAYFLKINVEDNAGGINPKLLSNLFKANCFSKCSEKGLGLGLYFANEIMKKYFHKKIKIKIRKDKGTKVSLSIKNCFILAEPKLKKKEVFILSKNK